MAILKEAEAGIPVKELCRKYGISNSTFYKWREKYGGMETSDIKRLKELEAENRKLKQMFAELSGMSTLFSTKRIRSSISFVFNRRLVI
ncbi:transposase [Gilliamella sp. Imp1-1]|nr:transposase [Gilliamella apicola]